MQNLESVSQKMAQLILEHRRDQSGGEGVVDHQGNGMMPNNKSKSTSQLSAGNCASPVTLGQSAWEVNNWVKNSLEENLEMI